MSPARIAVIAAVAAISLTLYPAALWAADSNPVSSTANAAGDVAVGAADTAGDVATSAANTAGDVAVKATDTAGDIAVKAVDTAGTVAKKTVKFTTDLLNSIF